MARRRIDLMKEKLNNEGRKEKKEVPKPDLECCWTVRDAMKNYEVVERVSLVGCAAAGKGRFER